VDSYEHGSEPHARTGLVKFERPPIPGVGWRVGLGLLLAVPGCRLLSQAISDGDRIFIGVGGACLLLGAYLLFRAIWIAVNSRSPAKLESSVEPLIAAPGTASAAACAAGAAPV